MKATDHNKKSGTTLVEVMLSIMILAILAAAAMSLLYHPRLQTVTAIHRQAAVHTANSAMDAVVSMGYHNISNAVGSYALEDFAGRHSMNGTELSGTRTVEMITLSGIDFKHCIIRIDYQGADRPVVIESLLAP